MSGCKDSRETVRETREAIADPERRDQLASDPGGLEAAINGILNLVNPRSVPNTTVLSEGGGCGGWYAAEELCFQMAIRSHTESGFQEWSSMADAYHTMGEACDALSHTL